MPIECPDASCGFKSPNTRYIKKPYLCPKCGKELVRMNIRAPNFRKVVPNVSCSDCYNFHDMRGSASFGSPFEGMCNEYIAGNCSEYTVCDAIDVDPEDHLNFILNVLVSAPYEMVDLAIEAYKKQRKKREKKEVEEADTEV